MKTIDELLEKLTNDGYNVELQKNDLERYRKAIKHGNPVTAQRKCDELCAAVRMLLSLEMISGLDALTIVENLREEGQADGHNGYMRNSHRSMRVSGNDAV